MARATFSVFFLVIAVVAAGFYWNARPAEAQSGYTITLIPASGAVAVGEEAWVTVRVEGPDPISVNVVASVVGADEFGQLAPNLVSLNVAEGGIQFVSSTPGTVTVTVSSNVGATASSTIQVVAPPTEETQGDRVEGSGSETPRPPAAGTGFAASEGGVWPHLAFILGAVMVIMGGLPLLVWQGKQA